MTLPPSELAQIVQSVVEPHLLSGPRRYTRAQVAELSQTPPDLVRRLWISLGFPVNPDDDALDYTDADIEALRAFRSLNFAANADVRLQTAAARTIGQSMARLAEWQVDLVSEEIVGRVAEGEPTQAFDIAATATDQVVALMQDIQNYAWRRHLAAALARSLEANLATPEPNGAGDKTTSGTTRTLAVGFADMVGFTRLTRHLDPEELTVLLETFEGTTTAAVTENGGWVIKNVGDEVMFAADSAVTGARIALEIQDRTEQSGLLTELRVGLAYGEVLPRFGDLFGPVVNVAARLTGVARPGTVLVDDATATELAGESDLALRHLRSVRVRGYNRLHSHVLRRA